jgi:hypothetical protein
MPDQFSVLKIVYRNHQAYCERHYYLVANKNDFVAALRQLYTFLNVT